MISASAARTATLNVCDTPRFTAFLEALTRGCLRADSTSQVASLEQSSMTMTSST